MSDEGPLHGAPTRRDTFKHGGAVVGGGSFAGCTDSSNSGSTSTESDGSTATETADPTETEESSYSVTMAPVGEVQFDGHPNQVTHYFPDYADVSVALGHDDSILSMGLLSQFHTSHYHELDGVSVEADTVNDTL